MKIKVAYLINKKVTFHEVDASFVRTMNEDGLRFFVHRYMDQDGYYTTRGSWNVTEFITGLAIVSKEGSRARAIAAARKTLAEKGIEKVWSVVLKHVEQYGPTNSDDKVVARLTVEALAK